jgi:2-iminobutanoate/2-iminopropanoate deaminase
MSNKNIIRTDKAPKPVGPYSQAVEAGGFVFCSGQISIDPATDQVRTGPIEEQTNQVIENIQAVLGAAGLNLNNVIKSTIYLTNMNDFTAVNEIYARYFVEQPPARTTIAVSALPKGVNVEIEVIAKR